MRVSRIPAARPQPGMEAWALLIFPVWVLLVSSYLLVVTGRGGVDEAGGAGAGGDA